MSRRSAAWAAAVTALLLTAAYLLTRRRRTAAPAEAPLPSRPPDAIGPDKPTGRDHVPLPSQAPVAEATTAPLPTRQVKSRSWQGRARPALPVEAATTTAVATQEPDEQPLPTWLRIAIVVAALIAFFAVSLIATKRV